MCVVDEVDCCIVGGGPAGMTAAIFLARFRRRICLIDSGESRVDNWAVFGSLGADLTDNLEATVELRYAEDEIGNKKTVPSEVLIEQIRKNRPHLSTATLGALPPGTASQLQVTSNVFRIEATGEVPGQGKRTLFAIVERASAQGGVAKVNVKNWRWLGEDDRHQ